MNLIFGEVAFCRPRRAQQLVGPERRERVSHLD
jgi:hypothetical protein